MFYVYHYVHVCVSDCFVDWIGYGSDLNVTAMDKLEVF